MRITKELKNGDIIETPSWGRIQINKIHDDECIWCSLLDLEIKTVLTEKEVRDRVVKDISDTHNEKAILKLRKQRGVYAKHNL